MSKLEQILILDPPSDLRFKGKGDAPPLTVGAGTYSGPSCSAALRIMEGGVILTPSSLLLVKPPTPF